MALAFAHAYGIPAVALRFFNIYGSRQALSNPYTGVAAIFSGRILAGQPPLIFEDGLQQRDFVHVSDVVQACRLAMSSSSADNQALNVGSGQPVTVLEVAETLGSTLRWAGEFEVTRQFRAGDIRHCFADISRIRALLGYQPRYAFRDGVAELVRWVAEQQGVADRLAEATGELAAYGLVR
jgi:dTDP-L-rhamnose 4-epimerase